MFDWLSGIKEGIVNLPGSIISGIIDGIKAIFVPSEDYISNRWNSIRQRFSFADSISATADIIVTFFKDTAFDEPPKVYVNFDYAESKYDYGGKTFCLDMSWYSRYKPTVDLFLSAWLWICFLWRVYTKLPAIIGGAAGDFEVIDNFSSKESLFNQGTKIRARREAKHSVNFRRNR